MTVFQDQPNPSAVLLRAGELVVQNLPVPELGPTDVLVNIKATGICGSDIHYFAHGRNGNIVVKEPLVMGHESSGEIVAIGSAVQSLKPGDRVAVEPGVTCRTCNMCKSGLYNLCPDVAFAATPPVHGTLCRYYKHPEDLCFKLPDNVSYEEGALVEPLSVGLYSIERGNVKVGDRVIIFGAGPVGLLCAAAAKAAGAACVMIADIAPSRLKFAASYYTDVQILLDKPSPNEPNIEYARRTATRILEDYGGYADCVLDCTGVETCKAVSYGSGNNACINGADVVVLAVKPQVMRKVVQELQVQDPNILVISIAAGIRTFDIQRWINSKDTSTAVVRCMPNTPALIGEGAAGLYATDAVSDAQRATAEAILKSIGKQVVWVEEEKHIDTVTGLSGSGPAYFFLFMEAMKAAGVESGLSPEVAEALVMQTCVGAGRMAQLSDDDLATLRQKVTSPNGTTEAALKTMEAGNIRKIIRDGVLAAENRGHELANEMGADD